ncbi:MAG: phosphatase PAP2 family protein [Acidobacteria bacterium]|nr:phosphatase PAP2 family protein [Acidobacteriota bacterium]
MWPVDWALIVYLSAGALLIAAFYGRVLHAGPLLAAHLGAVLLIAAGAFLPQRRPIRFFRDWYPVLLIALCYREMSILIAALRTGTADAWLADVDLAVWRAHPAAWLVRFQHPAVTEALELAYAAFVPSVILVGVVLWRREGRRGFRSYAFLITLGFLASYVGYLLVPARGPRFHLATLPIEPLQGVWVFDSLRNLLDRLESPHFDCFPSGHVEMTALAWWASRGVSVSLASAYSVYLVVTMLATVYLRYHYTLDVLAGLLTAAVVALSAPALERRLSHG